MSVWLRAIDVGFQMTRIVLFLRKKMVILGHKWLANNLTYHKKNLFQPFLTIWHFWSALETKKKKTATYLQANVF